MSELLSAREAALISHVPRDVDMPQLGFPLKFGKYSQGALIFDELNVYLS
jgi:hypothetical protein